MIAFLIRALGVVPSWAARASRVLQSASGIPIFRTFPSLNDLLNSILRESRAPVKVHPLFQVAFSTGRDLEADPVVTAKRPA